MMGEHAGYEMGVCALPDICISWSCKSVSH